jgi:membrane-bound lytic murein transglycosylase F
LKNLQEEIGQPIFVLEDSTSTMVQLAEKVSKGEIDLTVCDENMAGIYCQMYSNIDIGIPVSFRQNIAWAVRKDAVHLKNYIDSWLTEFMGTYKYKVIHDRYYNSKRNNFPKGSDFWQVTGDSISNYDRVVRQEATAQGWDWRLAGKYGKDPRKWDDVSFFLLKKSEEKYYSDEIVRWGYCNGREPYEFVRIVLSGYNQFIASIQ